MDELLLAQPQAKTSTFRQSGWKEIATGMIHEYYGSDIPPQDGSFVKLWDNVITTTSASMPFVEAVGITPAT